MKIKYKIMIEKLPARLVKEFNSFDLYSKEDKELEITDDIAKNIKCQINNISLK